MIGDFNAHMGVLEQGSNIWQGVLGKHGKNERNMAGVELLKFCAVSELSIMNTWRYIRVLGCILQPRNVI